MAQAQDTEPRKELEAWIPALIVFILALSARLAYIYYYRGSGYWDIMALDPETHDLLARRLANGLGLGERAYFRAPLYIYLLGAVYKLFEPGYMMPRIIQAFIGSASASMTYLIARRLLSGTAAFTVGLVASIYWVFIYFDGELLVEGLAVFLAMLALYMFVSGYHEKPAGALVAGLLLGLGAITRANFLLFAAAAIIISLLRRPARVSAALILAGLLLAVLPVTVRNLARAKDPVLISSQGGINFYMGNNPNADGRTPVIPIARRNIPSSFLARHNLDPWFKEDVWLSSVYGAEAALGKHVKESTVSWYWYKRSLKWIARHPLKWTRLMIRKTYFLFHRTEVSNNRDLDYHLEKIPLLKALAHLNFGIISPLFILGFIFSLSRIRKFFWLDVFVLTYGLSVILFFVNSRYRMPIIPAALILAADAVSRMAAWNAQKNRKALAAGLAAFLFLVWFTNADLARWNPRPLKAAMHYNLGLSLSRAKRFDKAADELRAAIDIKDEFPEAHLALGNALALSGREREALNEYQVAIIQQPDMAEAHYNMALTYARLKETDRARQHFKYAHELAPELFPAPPPPPEAEKR